MRMLGRVEVTRPETVSLVCVSCHRKACAHGGQSQSTFHHMAKDVKKRKLPRLERSFTVHFLSQVEIDRPEKATLPSRTLHCCTGDK